MNFVIRILLEQVAFTILKGAVKAAIDNGKTPQKEVNLSEAMEVFMGRKPPPKNPMDKAMDKFMGREFKPEPKPTPPPEPEHQIPPSEQELGDLIAQFMDRCKRADNYPGKTFSHEEAFSSLRINLGRLKPYMGNRVYVIEKLINFIDKALSAHRSHLPAYSREFIKMVMGG